MQKQKVRKKTTSKLLRTPLILLALLPLILAQAQTASSVYKSGLLFYENKDYQKAEKTFLEAVQTDPSYSPPYLSLALYYDEVLKAHEKAVYYYSAYLSLNGEKAKSVSEWLKRIVRLEAEHDPKDLPDIKQALRAYNESVVQVKDGNHKKALKLLNESLTLVPYYIGALYSRGLIYFQEQQFGQALNDLQKVYFYDPEYEDIRYYLALLYDLYADKESTTLKLYKEYLSGSRIPADRKKRVQELIEALKKIIDLKKKAYQAYSKHNLEEAKKFYESVLKIRPDNLSAHNNLGVIAYLNKDYKKAEEHYLQAKNLNPQDPSPYYNLACLFTARDDNEKALLFFRAGLAYMPAKLKQQALKDPDLKGIREDLNRILNGSAQ